MAPTSVMAIALKLRSNPIHVWQRRAGCAATGNARIEILQLKRKGDFIKFFKPTTTEKGSLLETGGGLYIRITKEGKELSLATGSTIKDTV
jgi:hypothetical protein